MSSQPETPSQRARIALRRSDRGLCTLTEALLSEVVRTLEGNGQGELAVRVTRAAGKLPTTETRYAARAEWYEHAQRSNHSAVAERYLGETMRHCAVGSAEPAMVRDARRLLLDSYVQPGCGLASTANTLGVSKEHLARRFKAHTGMTVLDYVHRLRISDALIAMTQNEQLKAVGFEVGYQSYNDFYRNFRKQLGVGPKQMLTEMRTPAQAAAGEYAG